MAEEIKKENPVEGKSTDPSIETAQKILKGKSLLGASYNGEIDGKMNTNFIQFLHSLESAIQAAVPGVNVMGKICTNDKLNTTADDIINAVKIIEEEKASRQ